jgi:hypothetical protein
VLANAAIKLLMKQDASTIQPVVGAFQLSDDERQFLLAAAKGEGLFFARGSHVAIKVEASPAEHRLVTTAPQELAERSAVPTGSESADADRPLRPLTPRRRLGSTGASR